MTITYEIYKVVTGKTHTTVNTKKQAIQLAEVITEETGIPFDVRESKQDKEKT